MTTSTGEVKHECGASAHVGSVSKNDNGWSVSWRLGEAWADELPEVHVTGVCGVALGPPRRGLKPLPAQEPLPG